MSSELKHLREKLCRELALSEHDAVVQTSREAAQLGPVQPADALRAIAAHAEHLKPRFDALLLDKQPVGISVGRFVGEIVYGLRQLIADRILRSERSYRATLLALRHGLDTARLLRDVARHEEHVHLFRFCDDLLAAREPLMREAERALGWFAEHPEIAIASRGLARAGSRMSLPLTVRP